MRYITLRTGAWLRVSALVGVLGLWVPSVAPGQFFRGSIVGTITDPSGASVPGVRVSLTNQGTNEVRETYTDQGGDYTLPALLPGLYTIETVLESFQTRAVKDIKLDVNQTARIDVTLEVGEVVERIEVTAPLLLLKQDSSEVGHVITNKQIVDLPLNGRDFLQLARLIPGATPSRAGANSGAQGRQPQRQRGWSAGHVGGVPCRRD